MNRATDRRKERKLRLKDNLRANLQKRKHQARERSNKPAANSSRSPAEQAKD